MSKHQALHRAKKQMPAISDFGRVMKSPGHDLPVRVFTPLNNSITEFQKAVDRAMEYSWRTKPGLYD